MPQPIKRLETHHYIEYAAVVDNPQRGAFELLLQREYHAMHEELDRAEQLPGWLQLAHALQGSE